MHFVKTLAVGLSAVVAAVAQSGGLAFTSQPSSVQAGVPTVLTYTSDPNGGPISIVLRFGDPNNLGTAATITSSAPAGSFTWTPDPSLPNRPDYALEIDQGTLINFSGQFPLTGGSDGSSSSTSSGTSTATTSSSSVPPTSVIPPYAAGNSTVPMASGTGSVGTTSPMGTGAPVPNSNTTTPSIVSPTLSATTTAGRTSTASTGPAATTSAASNGAAQVGSSFALIVGAVAALAALN